MTILKVLFYIAIISVSIFLVIKTIVNMNNLSKNCLGTPLFSILSIIYITISAIILYIGLITLIVEIDHITGLDDRTDLIVRVGRMETDIKHNGLVLIIIGLILLLLFIITHVRENGLTKGIIGSFLKMIISLPISCLCIEILVQLALMLIHKH